MKPSSKRVTMKPQIVKGMKWVKPSGLKVGQTKRFPKEGYSITRFS